MDWSLVLVSQGIETIIERDSGTGHWGLVVSQPDYPRAVGALRQYCHENRHRVWRREVPGTGLIFDARALVWIVVLVFVYALDDASGGRLREHGLMDSAAIYDGAWWRLFTATQLHGDLVHLATNATTGFLLLGLVMGAFGTGWGLLAAFLAGVGGNLAGLVLLPETHRSLGASGMVMGALGILTGESVAVLREGVAPRRVIGRALAGGFLLLVLWGFSPDPRTDVVAHVGGFLGGIAIGGVMSWLPAGWLRSVRLNLLAGAAVAALVTVTWWLALRR